MSRSSDTKQANLYLVLMTLTAIVMIMGLTLHMPTVYAADDDKDEEYDDDTDYKDGTFTGINTKAREGTEEREYKGNTEEREYKGEDDDNGEEKEGEGLGSNVASMVLYATVAAVAGVIGYTGWKILKMRSKVKV
ncbi:MAG: hypothetical protein QXS98_01610 [Candidatus Nitrosocaldus sp.]